jgi:hypothetical protein
MLRSQAGQRSHVSGVKGGGTDLCVEEKHGVSHQDIYAVGVLKSVLYTRPRLVTRVVRLYHKSLIFILSSVSETDM